MRVDAIGDFVLWLPAAAALRSIFPPESHSITLLCNRDCRELANALPFWDDVWEMDRRCFEDRRGIDRWRLLWRIRRARFDIAVQPTFSREAGFGDRAIWASSARRRIGFAADLSNLSEVRRAKSDGWYTELVAATPGILPELERNAEFVRALGVKGFALSAPNLPPLPGERDFEIPAQPYFIVFPGASRAIRRWPAAKFAGILHRLHAQTGWLPLICGGSTERVVADEVAAASATSLENRSGTTSLIEFVALLRGARILISNETAAVHLAAAVGTPSVCIAGGGHWGRFVPYPESCKGPCMITEHKPCFGCNWRCIYHPGPDAATPCVAEASENKVWTAICGLLGLPSGA